MTLATNIPNDQLLDNLLQAKNSTVIPFVKKFLHKLRNSSSRKDVNQLKDVNFQMINDMSYFHKEEKNHRALNTSKGVEFIALKLRNLIFDLNFVVKTSFLISLIKTFFKNNVKVLHPYQNFKISWDIIHLIMIIFWFFYLPLLISFFEANYYSMLYLKFSLLFFCFDIMITLNSAYFKSGVLETKRSKIIANYFKQHIIKDIIAILPLVIDYSVKMHLSSSLFNCIETLGDQICHKGDDEETLDFIITLRKLNFIKILIYIKLKDFTLIYSRILEKFLIQETYQNIISLIKIAYISLLFAHIIGCLWHFVADIQYPDQTWLSAKGLVSSPWLEKYLYSIYWSSVTIMTVGYGDIVPQNNKEVMVALITIIFGCGVYAFNLNSIGMILQDINKENNRFKHNINIINQFMKRKNVNQDLQMRVREYLRFIWKEEKAQNLEEETHIINVLSGNLKEELLLEAYGQILRKYPVFYANFSEKALKKTVNFIKDYKYIPEELIYDEGAVEDPSIYFIMKGEVEIYSNKTISQKETAQPQSNNKEIPLKRLQPGEFFGEIGFFTGNPRLASARSRDFTTLFSIKRSDFIGILNSQESFIDDYDKFCMIRDQILLYENYNSLRMRCFSCNQLGHLSSKCSLIHYIPDNEKIIKTHNFHIDQERRTDFKRKLIKPSVNALFHRKTIDQVAMTFRAEILKVEENMEKNRHKNLKTLMRNLTGRMIFEEDSSLEEDEDDEDTSMNEGSPGEDLVSNDIESNIQIDVEEKKTNEFLSNPVENISILKTMNFQMECEENNKFMKPDYMKESQNVNFSKFAPRSSKQEIMEKSSKQEIMEKSSIIITQSPQKRSSLSLPFKPLKYRHSALATIENSKIDKDEDKQKSSPDTGNSKKNAKKTANDQLQLFVNHPSQKSILKNGINDGMSSCHSFTKMKASAISKMKNGDSSSFLPDLGNPTKKSEETKQSHISSSTFNANVMEELIKTIECFENAKNFKNYFPDNNLNKLINLVNSQESTKRLLPEKLSRLQKITKQLSKYTFFSQEMRNKMPDIIMKRIRNSKGSKSLATPTPVANTGFILPAQSPDKKSPELLSSGLQNKKKEFFGNMKLSNKMKFVDLAEFLIKNGDLRRNLMKKKKMNFLKWG